MNLQQDVPKRPRLSLQIKTTCSPATKSSRSYAVDPRDPTAFNTLSNVYVTAIERSTPVHTEPAVTIIPSFSLASPVDYKDFRKRPITPYVASYPETPLSATASSPRPMEINFPSAMTATPPLSAGPVETNNTRIFSFSAEDISGKSAEDNKAGRSDHQSSIRRPIHQTLVDLRLQQPPYTHPQALHSILRNSPLPPPTAIPLPLPRRQSLRLQEKASKKVEYNNPLTQDIVNNLYTRSHIDLLVEEASPRSPPSATMENQNSLDLALAFQPNEIEDGGQTPGPMEDIRSRMAGLGTTPSSPSSPRGIRKRKKKEKKRRWVWTIGQEDDDGEPGGSIMALRAGAKQVEAPKAGANEDVRTPLTAIPILKIPTKSRETPTPSIESTGSESESHDVEMSDTSSCMSQMDNRDLTPMEMEVDLKTPISLLQEKSLSKQSTPTPSGLQVSTGTRRDTPVPPVM